MKRCTACKADKDASEFHRNRATRDGLTTICIQCSKERAIARKLAGEVRTRKRVDWARGLFECCKCKRVLQLSAFHVRRQRNNQPRSTCKECLKAATRAWLTTEHGKAWRAAYQREKLRRDPAYYAVHRANVDANNALRRGAREVGERFSRDEIYQRDKGKCHLCGKLARKDDWDLEHVIPLSKGGAHARNNVAVAHPSCNGSKHARVTHLF